MAPLRQVEARWVLLAGVVLMTGCASQTAYLSAGETGFGQTPYQVGPVTVVIRPQAEVELICRLRAPAVAANHLRIQGCYVPEDRMIVSVADPHVLLHEFKHHFEGAWHR